MKYLLIIFIFILGCSKVDEQALPIEQPQYYIDGRITNESNLFLFIYKMTPFEKNKHAEYIDGWSNILSLKILEPVYLRLIDGKGNASDTSFDSIVSHTGFIELPSLSGEVNSHYSLTLAIGKDTSKAVFYIPDSFVVDTYKINMKPGQESLHFQVQLPSNYTDQSLVFTESTYATNGPDIIWDFCEMAPPVEATQVKATGYLDWYAYADCDSKRSFNSGNHDSKIRVFNHFFEPRSGRYVHVMHLNTYNYLKDLNQHIDANLKGTSYPINMPSMFDSGVFYGGIVAYYSRHVLFSER